MPDHMQIALAELRTARRAMDRTEAALHRAIEDSLQAPLETALQQPLEAASEHRRAHRPGRPSRIDTDDELRAFILARLDHMTFQQLAEAVAATFPPSRHIGKSAIHKWWTRQCRKPHPR